MNNMKNNESANMPNISSQSLKIVSYGLSLANFLMALYLAWAFAFSDESWVKLLTGAFTMMLVLSLLVVTPLVYTESKRKVSSAVGLVIASIITGPIFGLIMFVIFSFSIKLFGAS